MRCGRGRVAVTHLSAHGARDKADQPLASATPSGRVRSIAQRHRQSASQRGFGQRDLEADAEGPPDRATQNHVGN